MKRLKKILTAIFFFSLFGLENTWALDQADFQKIEHPVEPHSFDVFNKVPLYYLESPPGVRFIETGTNGNTVHFYLNPQSAEAARFKNEKSSAANMLVKKISMPVILRAVYSQSRTGLADSSPRLVITEGESATAVSFYYLSDITTGQPYTLDIKRKKTVPVFLSSESAENTAKIITVATSQNLQVEKKDLAGFLNFLTLQETSGQRVQVLAYASRPEYNEIRPMTFGVFSSYMLGTLLVLFLFWAITAASRKRST